MFKAIKFSILFFTFLLLNGCASSCGSAVDTNSNNNQANQVVVPERADNAKIPDNTNTNMVNGLANSNAPNPTLDNSKVKVINPDTSKIEAPKKKMPDNSQMSARSVGADFVETREFLSNKQLDKLERIISGKNSKFKVYLKNGKVYDLEESKLKDYKKDSAATILKAVGVTPIETKEPPEVKGQKKDPSQEVDGSRN